MKINLSLAGAKQIQESLRGISERGLDEAIVEALNSTAFYGRKKTIDALKSGLDRPKPYTLSGVQVVKADPSRAEPAAYVGLDVLPVQNERLQTVGFRNNEPGSTARGAYLGQLQRGERKTKRMERALQAVGVLPNGWTIVPGQKARLDAYGNQLTGEINQILSYFQARSRLAGSQTNSTAETRAKRLKGSSNKRRVIFGFEYIVIQPGQTSSGNRANNLKQPGIYRAVQQGPNRRIQPVMIFVQKNVYRSYFNLDAILQQAAADKLQKNLQFQINRVFKQERASASA